MGDSGSAEYGGCSGAQCWTTQSQIFIATYWQLLGEYWGYLRTAVARRCGYLALDVPGAPCYKQVRLRVIVKQAKRDLCSGRAVWVSEAGSLWAGSGSFSGKTLSPEDLEKLKDAVMPQLNQSS